MHRFDQAFEPIAAGSLQVRLAQDEAEVRASQRLRYRIFCGEMGGTLTPEVMAQERDFDVFDDVCDHMLVIDSERTGESAIVGTYRLLRKQAMKSVGRFYTEGEYDITPLKSFSGELLELGRSCVNAEYRNRAVMTLLWRGIGAYVTAFDIKLMFGCASFTGAKPADHALALAYLYYHHLGDDNIRLKALPDQYVDMRMMPREQVSEKEALKLLPPLIKGYLRLGGKVGDGAVIDYACNTTDIAIVVQTDQVGGKYADRYKPEE